MTVVYDSGSVGEDAGVWSGYFLSADASPRPFNVLVSIEPVVTPNPSWNLGGWACIGTLRESVRNNSPLTPVALLPQVSGLPYVVLNRGELEINNGRIVGVRAVRWSLNDWLGKCRVRVIFQT